MHSDKNSPHLFGFSKLFYYLCKAQLSHIPLPAHPLSRETASPASSYHQAPHSPHGTRTASRITHTRLPRTLHLAKGYAHAPHTRYASSPSQHTRPPRYHPSQRAMPHAPRTRYAPSPSQHPRPPRYHPSQRATPCSAITKHESHTPPRTHAPQVFCEESASPITTKILHITILHVTFTRIGVKTTQKSEAIFSFID